VNSETVKTWECTLLARFFSDQKQHKQARRLRSQVATEMKMLWYKTWVDTRWVFYLGLASFLLVSVITVFIYPVTLRKMAEEPDAQRRFLFLLHDMNVMKGGYAAYVWSTWFGNSLPALWTIFSLLFGWTGLATEQSSKTAFFTLSLPVSRRRWLTVRFVSSAIQLLVLTLISSLTIPLLSRLIGQTFAVPQVGVYASHVIAGGLVFLSLAFLLTNVMGRDHVAGTIAWIVVGGLWWLSLTETFAPYSVYRMMGGERYFFTGAVPWSGLAVSLSLALVMFYTSVRVAERCDV
jgi:ABC-type transport system involved in multi-copper enzyme maturation permease subunit